MSSQVKFDRHSTLRSTLKCIAVLCVISVVCVALLAVANKFMQVKITLTKQTCDIINTIAPTGADNDTAYNDGHIRLVDLSAGEYPVADLNKFNKQYGSSTQKVLALYTSTDIQSGKVTYVVEAQGKGHVDAIVLLIAYDGVKVAEMAVKSQSESYWDRLTDYRDENGRDIFEMFIGTQGNVTGKQIATSTGASNSLRGMADAVSVANRFVALIAGV